VKTNLWRFIQTFETIVKTLEKILSPANFSSLLEKKIELFKFIARKYLNSKIMRNNINFYWKNGFPLGIEPGNTGTVGAILAEDVRQDFLCTLQYRATFA